MRIVAQFAARWNAVGTEGTARPMKVSTQQAADFFGVTYVTMRNWLKQSDAPPPLDPNTKPLVYDSAALVQFRIRKSSSSHRKGGDLVTADEAHRRKETALAELRELELAEKRGEVIPLDDIEDALAARESNMRARLLAIPTTVAMLLEGMTADERRKVIADAVAEALEELAALPVTEGAADD